MPRWKSRAVAPGPATSSARNPTTVKPDQVPLLFQEFQQLPNSRTADQGTGLGLALTRHIVEAQGGQVAVRSEPGRGSVFSAVLPLNGGDGS